MQLANAIFLFISVTFSFSLAQNTTTYYEHLLVNDLLNGYDKNVKPDGQVIVEMQVYLMQIINVAEKDQAITLNTWITEIWYDERLAWDPASYGNITYINLPSDLFWIPDTMILTSADPGLFLKPIPGALFAIDPDGRSYFSRMTNNLISRCKMNLLWFPFDEQTCTIVLASTIFGNDSIKFSDYGENTFKLFNYVNNKVWQLVSYNYKFVETFYPGYDGVYSEIHLNLRIRRKPLFIVANLVVPALCLTAITLVSYFIPFGQAMSLSISTVLAHSVLAIRLNDYLPPSDSMPALSIYFVICMTFTVLSIVYFATVNKLKDRKRLPICIKYFIVYYLTLCFCGPKTRKKILRAFIKPETDNSNINNAEDLTPEQLFLALISLLNRFVFAIIFLCLLILNLVLFVFIPGSMRSTG